MSNLVGIPQAQQVVEARQSEVPSFLAMIERAARDPAVDVDKFERLMAMKERVEANEARKAFNAAIANAKGEIPPILKGNVVSFGAGGGKTNYQFEDFASIARVVDPILQAQGLTYRFRAAQHDGRLAVTCILSHADGYCEETTLEAPEDKSGSKNAIQGVGSAATYLQRYTLKLALGLSTSKDDDGRASARATADDYGAIPEAMTNVDDLIAAGRAAAKEGMISLGAWWTKTLTAQQRRDLGVATLNELKTIAGGH